MMKPISFLTLYLMLWGIIPLLSQPLHLAQQQEILHAHNTYRSELNLPNLEWSNALEKSANRWAKYLVDNNLFEHSEHDVLHPVGENLWQGTSGAFSLTAMVDAWGSEKQYYRRKKIPEVDPPFQKETGHYTQIVWKNTLYIGCALRQAEHNYIMFVCHYSPQGNMVGEYPY